jgi:hypothetical protein
MRLGTMLGSMAVLALAATATGCGDNEVEPPGHSSPVAARLVVNGVEIDDGGTLTLTTGAAVEIEVRLLDVHGDVVEGIEDDHHVKLNFDPAELATSADVVGHNFRKTVTAQAGEGGTLSVGYGHDADASEKSFGTFYVEVVAPPCVCGRGGAPEVELVFGSRSPVPLGG